MGAHSRRHRPRAGQEPVRRREPGCLHRYLDHQLAQLGAFLLPQRLPRPIANKRKNLVVLPNQTVTRIIWDTEVDEDGNRRALGVEFAADASAPRVHVTARREVILSAGAIGSPQILQLSGFGCKELLAKNNVTLVKELPGVGQNLQDHLSGSVSYSPAEGLVMPSETNLTKKASFVDSSVAYVTLEKMYGANETANFLERAKKFSADYIKSATNVPEAVRRGWAKQYKLLLEDLLVPKSKNGFTGTAKGAVEMLLGISTGSAIQVETALQAPFSRGWVEIASNNPLTSRSSTPTTCSTSRTSSSCVRASSSRARWSDGALEHGRGRRDHARCGGEQRRGPGQVHCHHGGHRVPPELDVQHAGRGRRRCGGQRIARVRHVERARGGCERHPDLAVVALMSATYAVAEVAADLIKACPFEVVDECAYDGEGDDEADAEAVDAQAEEDDEDCEDDE